MALLLERLNAAFREDPGIDEYALVPAACPELFGAAGTEDLGCIAAQQKLAISIEGALLLYLHAYQVMQKAMAHGQVQAALESSRAVLLCSADCVRAWDCREQLLAHLDLEAELLFSALLLRTNHKSGETCTRGLSLQRFCGKELALVEELAKRYDHHYYAWNHWAWLDRQSIEGPAMDFPELAFTTPSHYGLFHHRLVRLQRHMGHAAKAAITLQGMEDLQPFGVEAFTEEWNLALKLLQTYPHLEAPWAFRAQLFALLLEQGLIKIQDVAKLWKGEVERAQKLMESAESQRWARRFQVHILQDSHANTPQHSQHLSSCMFSGS
eukprot:g11181.t1